MHDFIHAIKLVHNSNYTECVNSFIDRISSDDLLKQMDAEKQKLWNGRKDKLIVLVDDESKSVDTAGKTSLPVLILKDAIYKV